MCSGLCSRYSEYAMRIGSRECRIRMSSGGWGSSEERMMDDVDRGHGQKRSREVSQDGRLDE
jgi:hypothetical protein